LVEFNERRNKNNNNDNDDNDYEEVGLTTKDLDATFRIRERRFSTQQIYETYIDPLVNAGYIDKIENKQDKRSYIFFPVLNAKQKNYSI
jgi:DNA-binding MarR family transcriptional regulator